MNQLKYTTTKCPTCNSSATRSREMVYKSGTSFYEGVSRTYGCSFNLFGKARPRVWVGRGRSSGVRQSILAQESGPFKLPFLPLLLLILVNYQIGLLLTLIWVILVIRNNNKYYKTQWICSKCGTYFIPELAKKVQDEIGINYHKVLQNIQSCQSNKR